MPEYTVGQRVVVNDEGCCAFHNYHGAVEKVRRSGTCWVRLDIGRLVPLNASKLLPESIEEGEHARL